MKRIIIIVLAIAMMLPLVGCSGKTMGKIVSNIGKETSVGNYKVTLESFSFVDSIPSGKEVKYSYHVGGYGRSWGPFKEEVKPRSGFAIMKVSFEIGYEGKEEKWFNLANCIKVDYNDGYTFTPLQIKSTTKDSPINEKYLDGEEDSDGVEHYTTYLFNSSDDLTINISNPLSFSPVKKTVYIFVDKKVKEDTESPLYLSLTLPNEPAVKFDLRKENTSD